MAAVLDVAAYILRHRRRMTAMKLQKLCYYGQAWSLVWDERPLFPERIEAWANGPVVPALFEHHRGKFELADGDLPGDPAVLTKDERETVDGVLEYYGHKSAQWLSDLTHAEDPWVNARRGLEAGRRSSSEITLDALAQYYGNL